jgi:glycine cleavage system P protein (glycine dehydrogenase) subunit 2
MNKPDRRDLGASLTFDRTVRGRRAVDIPVWDGPVESPPPSHVLRDALPLPELSQGELVRYYTALSQRNFGVDSGSYPLGSCTMKYNPKVNDLVATLPGFEDAHPHAPASEVQGTLGALHDLQTALAALTGLPAVSLAPAAGAQGELAGLLMIKKALAERGVLGERRRILVPDSAHGTNPASATMAGFSVTHIPTDSTGVMERKALAGELDDTVAALMVTTPNTLGLWETGVEEVALQVHEAGAYMYGDGANFNAILGRVRFGDLGFDVVHLNLHKTFSTPHGGGGPGAGPVCVADHLADYLPDPVIERTGEGGLALKRPPRSIGRVQAFHGSAAVLLRAHAYILALGLAGLRAVSESAVLNANYLRSGLLGAYELPYDRRVMHEVVFSASRQKRESGIHAYDIAKRLIDHGIHPPTIYFPLIVEEALMIEPTDTESREDLDRFVEVLRAIAQEAEDDPDALRAAPRSAPIGRLDEANAARHPVLRWDAPR